MLGASCPLLRISLLWPKAIAGAPLGKDPIRVTFVVSSLSFLLTDQPSFAILLVLGWGGLGSWPEVSSRPAYVANRELGWSGSERRRRSVRATGRGAAAGRSQVVQ